MIADGERISPREILDDALRYWERRRIAYNALLVAVVGLWVLFTWPHFSDALSLKSLTILLMLAAGANICYCAAYVADIPMQYSSMRATWRRWRWGVWLAGTVFALLLANYWIADEIYPYVVNGGT
ncbi:MAG TPA: hypothetical protein VF348_09765 [Usitatibacter sp.]